MKTMFVEAFPKFESAKVIRVLRAYFGSVWNVIVVAALMTVSSLFGLELPVLYCYVALTLLVCFFCRDTLGILPIVCFTPLSLSVQNNPATHPETIFNSSSALVQIGFCAVLLVVLLLARLISCLIQNPKRGFPRLTVGFAVLAVAYIIGGIQSPYYSGKTALFGVLQSIALCIFYFYFYFTVNWKSVDKGYLASVFAVLGFALVIQVLNMYFQDGVIVDGVIDRGKLFPGWGTYNAIGCITAMCVPAAFYFAATQKQGWIFTLLGTVIFMGVILTQSRGSILFGAIIYIVSVIVTIAVSKRRERIGHLVLLALTVIAVVVCVIVFREKLKNIFDSLLKVEMDDNGRKPLFEEAWKYFLNYPVFGVGWGGERWLINGNSFLHYFMAHNTYLQILGSLGVFGMAAYLFHRVQTLFVLFRRFNVEKCFIALIIGALLLTCLTDCHLYSFYPAIYYSVLLLFLEGINKRGDDGNIPHSKKRKKKEKGSANLHELL